MNLNFTVTAKDPSSKGRLGRFTTSHGKVETPVFMPVGTQATVKTLDPDEVWARGYRIILAAHRHEHRGLHLAV